MSNVSTRQLLTTAAGVAAGALALQLNGPAAWAAPGGSNLASVTNTSGGNLLLQSALTVTSTGLVGVGTAAPAYALDVSGACRASAFRDGSGNPMLTSAAALWSQGATAFQRDDGTGLSVGAGGTLTCRYFWFGAMVTAEIRMTVGAGASLGLSSQGWCWTLPVTLAATSADTAVGTALLRSYGGTGGGNPICFTGVAYATAAGTAVKVLLDGVSAVGATLDAPFAWQPGDSLSLLMSYEASGVQQPATAVPVGFTQSAVASSNCMGLGLAPGTAAAPSSLVVAGAVGIGGTAVPAYALDVSGGARFTGTLVASNVSVVGSIEIVNAYETHTSNLVITNVGTGPALTVSQVETGPMGAQPCALFTAGSNVGLYVSSTGGVGVGQSNVKAGFALDVSGSVNATSLIVGGSTNKQIDCGTSSFSNGTRVAFNFTFINVPNVCANVIGNWGATTVCYVNIFSITNTGFYVSSAHLDGAFPILAMGAQTLTWIAIG